MNFLNDGHQSKFTPHIILILLFGVVFMLIGQIGGMIVFDIIKYYIDLNYIVYDILMLILSFIFIDIVLYIYMKFVEKRMFSTLGFYKENRLFHFFKGFFIGALLFSTIILILFLTNHIRLDKNPTILTGYKAILPVVLIIPGWIIQGGTEEILTRGWILQTVNARYNKYVALIASSAFFGIMHLGNDSVSTIAIINIILMGLLFSVYSIKTNNIWGACGMHASWNFVQGNIFGLEVSGNNLFKYSLFKFNVNGNELITGGHFGPEASIISTAVITLFILYLIYKKKKAI